MDKITTIGLDIAKTIFHTMCCDARGKVVKKRMLKRREVLAFFARQVPCLIGMEACGNAGVRSCLLPGLFAEQSD